MTQSFALLAPAKVVAKSLTTESIQVTITASGDTTGAHHYLTTTKEDPSKSCEGEQCTLSGLGHAKKYTVESRACLTEPNACSDPVEDATWTKPTRMILYLHLTVKKLFDRTGEASFYKTGYNNNHQGFVYQSSGR